MRPINKGESPYKTISEYSEALQHLIDRIGPYCSYCGFPIRHVPEVEHISAKSAGGDWTAWCNLLLGCKYCNARKSQKVTPHNKDEYLWPDVDNTAIAYTYVGGIPKVNEEELIRLDPSGKFLEKAKKLFELLALDNVPGPGSKDRRFYERFEVYDVAQKSLQNWREILDSKGSVQPFLDATIDLARYSGFFSIWVMVFIDEPMVLHALIDAFPGTERTFFDKNGRPKLLLNKNMENTDQSSASFAHSECFHNSADPTERSEFEP